MTAPAMSPTEVTSGDERSPLSPTIKIDPSKDLWQNISMNVKESANAEQIDQTVLVVGAKSSGKSSLVVRMLGSNVKTKPTTALEYSFGKRDERNTTQIAHFWELAQGQELSQLADVVVTAENVHSVVVVIVVDCADPNSMFETSTFWLKRVDRRVQEIFQKMKAKGSQTPDKLVNRAKRLVGEGHPDLSRMRISGLPTIVIGSRIDLFKGDTSKLKLMVRTLRYLAHLYGASVLFTSDQAAEVSKFRQLLNSVVFQTPFDTKFVQFDPERGGVLLTPDRDTFKDIGDPNASNMSEFKSTGDSEIDRWKSSFDEAFPPRQQQKETKLVEDPFLSKLYDSKTGYGEPAIDSMRKQKDEELEQYRRNSTKKASEKEKDA